MQLRIQDDFWGIRSDQIIVLTLRIRADMPEQTVLSQIRCAERGVWSGSTLLATLKAPLYALSLPLGVYLPLGVNICLTLLNTPMGKPLRLYVF